MDYTYALTDTASGTVDGERLDAEVRARLWSQPFTGVTTTGTSFALHFDAALGAPEVTVLDAIVAAHTGDPVPEVDPVIADLQAQIDALSATVAAQLQVTATEHRASNLLNLSSENKQVMISTGPLAAGKYLVLLNADAEVNNSNTYAEIDIAIDGVQIPGTPRAWGKLPSDSRGSVDSHATITVTEGAVVQGRISRTGSGRPITIRDRVLTLVRVQ